MHQGSSEKNPAADSRLQKCQETNGAVGAVSAASCSTSHRPSEQRFRLQPRNDADDSGAVVRSKCEQPEKNERNASASVEIDAEYVAKFASRFQALMERRERRLEQAMSDPQTRTDLEAMFPGMKHGDYQTLLTGVRGMEEEEFQVLLEGARKRRRQNEGGHDEWEDRKSIKILNHLSHAPLQRSPNPRMPWPPWDRDFSTSSHRNNRHAFTTVGDRQYSPLCDPYPESSHLFEHSRPDPPEPYPRYERYADRGGDMESERNPPGRYRRRAVCLYDNDNWFDGDRGCHPGWRHEQQASHRWRTAERSSSWGESSPNSHQRQTYHAHFKGKPIGYGGHETDEPPHPSYSGASGISSGSPHEEAAGSLNGAMLRRATPPALAAATRTPPIGCDAEPAQPPLIVRAGPPGPLCVPGEHPGIDRALCEAVDRIYKHRERVEGGGGRSGGSPGKRDSLPAASRAGPGMLEPGDNGVVCGGRGRHRGEGGTETGPNLHEARLFGHMAECCGGRREELMANPPGTRAEIEAVLPGGEGANDHGFHQSGPLGYSSTESAYGRERDGMFVRGNHHAHHEEPDYGLYSPLLGRPPAQLKPPMYREEEPDRCCLDGHSAYTSAATRGGRGDVGRGENGGYQYSRDRIDFDDAARSAHYQAAVRSVYGLETPRNGHERNAGGSLDRRTKRIYSEEIDWGSGVTADGTGPSYPNKRIHLENEDVEAGVERQGWRAEGNERLFEREGVEEAKPTISRPQNRYPYMAVNGRDVLNAETSSTAVGGSAPETATASKAASAVLPSDLNAGNKSIATINGWQQRHGDDGSVGDCPSSQTDSSLGATTPGKHTDSVADCASETEAAAIGSRCSTPCPTSRSSSPANGTASNRNPLSTSTGLKVNQSANGRWATSNDTSSNTGQLSPSNRAPDDFESVKAFLEVVKDKAGFTRLYIPENPPVVPRRPPSKGNKRETLADIAHRIPVGLLRRYFNYPLRTAAEAMNISVTTLKRLCRRHGVRRWPHRQISGINRAMAHLGFQQDQEGRRADSQGGKRADPHMSDQMHELLRRRRVMIEHAFESDDGVRQNAFDSEDEAADADSFFADNRAGAGRPSTHQNHVSSSVHGSPAARPHDRHQVPSVNTHQTTAEVSAEDGVQHHNTHQTTDNCDNAADVKQTGLTHPEAGTTPGYGSPSDNMHAGQGQAAADPRSTLPLEAPPLAPAVVEKLGLQRAITPKTEPEAEESAQPAPSLSLPAARVSAAGRMAIHAPAVASARSHSRSPTEPPPQQPRSPLTCGPIASWHERVRSREDPEQGAAGAETASNESLQQQQQQQQQRKSLSSHQHRAASHHSRLAASMASLRAQSPPRVLPEMIVFNPSPSRSDVWGAPTAPTASASAS